MSLSTFTGDVIDASLHQLDVSRIKVVSGKQHIVDFDLGEGLDLTYVFNVTNEDRFYLQRAEPYPVMHGRFASQEEIIRFIAKDSQAFRNARKSKNYQNFVETARSVLSLTEDVERLFLNRNVSQEDLNLLHAESSKLKALIREIEEHAPVIHND